ncbi:putative ligninase H2 [Rosellinia necatrix]|uniref:Peroxidase n=1 Tax=Rosellinia necatrix TaxID=77044 RepID=A0A1S8AA46_ROSNE|nr:putative ligninase H2 [Rosellinia necatrix]
MGANVATVVCPLGPRVRSFVGRVDSVVPNKAELLPSAFADAVDLIRLFREKTIGPHALVALLGAHTTSQQRHTDPTRPGDPQDSTPGVWDVLYYEETYGTVKSPDRVFKFPSDVALAKYSVTAREWVSFLGTSGQAHWNTDYASAYIRLSLLGVNNINHLTECTRALPARTLEYKNPDQESMDEWLKSSRVSLTSEEIADRIELGGIVDINNGFSGNGSIEFEL